MTESRLKHVDVARGIAIISIIIGHMGIREVERFVFTFHVPIFFLISGYFISERSKFSEFVQRKAKTLLLPYYLTCLVFILLAALEGYLDGGTRGLLLKIAAFTNATIYGAGNAHTEPILISGISAIWFLWAAFWGNILLKISLRLKEKERILLIGLLFLLGICTKDILWLPLSIQPGCCATLFMYVGYLYRRTSSIRESCSEEIKHVWLLFATIVWIFFVKDFKSFWFVSCDFGRGIIDIFGSLCACYVVIQLSKLISKVRGLGQGLAFVGENSLYILCVHDIELWMFPWKEMANFFNLRGMPESWNIPLILIGKLIMDISLAWLLSKVKIVAKRPENRVDCKQE